MFNLSKKSLIGFAGFIVVSIFAGWLAGSLFKINEPATTNAAIDQSFSSLASRAVPPPATMDDWIKGTDAIVDGVVIRVVHTGYVSLDNTGKAIWDKDSQNEIGSNLPTPTPSASLPQTDYEVLASKVYRSDGTIVEGKSFIFIIRGHIGTIDTDQTALPQVGERNIYVLKHSPDQGKYNLGSECGRLVVNLQGLQCPGKGQTLLPFMEGIGEVDFVNKLQSSILKEK